MLEEAPVKKRGEGVLVQESRYNATIHDMYGMQAQASHAEVRSDQWKHKADRRLCMLDMLSKNKGKGEPEAMVEEDSLMRLLLF